MAGKRLTKSEMVNQLAIKLDVSRQRAKEMIDSFVEMIVGKLVEDPDSRVSLHGFGTFEICKHKSRRGVDPRDHEKDIKIPERSVPKFRAGKSLKRAVRNAFDAE